MGIVGVIRADRRAVFLDRDGVLNRAFVREGRPYPPASLAELEILPDVAGALRRLKEAGFVLVVVTNQPDVRRGGQRREVVEAINEALLAELPCLDEILVCYHDDDDYCNCRKPLPGLMKDAAVRHGIDLSRSFVVGDRWRDVEAGHGAGCATVFLDRGYAELRPRITPDHTAYSLAEAAFWIANRSGEQEGEG